MNFATKQIESILEIDYSIELLLPWLKFTGNFVDIHKKLLTFLATNKTHDNKKRKFIVSSIVMGEFLKNAPKKGQKEAIISKALNTNNLEFIPFNNSMALFMVNNYHDKLRKEGIKSLQEKLDYSFNSYVLAREWISRDLMIIATSEYKNSDVLLTCDIKTMYRTSVEIGASVAIAEPRYFDHSGQNVFHYNRAKLHQDLGYTH